MASKTLSFGCVQTMKSGFKLIGLSLHRKKGCGGRIVACSEDSGVSVPDANST